MTTRKRNEWLEAGLSEEEDVGYDSEAAEESRGHALGGRALKRRRVGEDSDVESVSGGEDEDTQDKAERARKESEGAEDRALRSEEDEDEDEDEDDANAPTEKPSKDSSKKVAPLTQKQLEKSQKAAKKTGVIYISRVPPFMKPQTVRHLLQPYGAIGRIFLTPEDPNAHKQRVKAGGNKKKSFTDGWVEFLDKKQAKIVAETLNAQIIGGKKGGWYHDDVWNIKYLKGFKWHHLTEQIANENAERAARLRAEIAQTTRENKAFLQNVERAKMLEGIEAKKKKKAGGNAAVAAADESSAIAAENSKAFRRQFRQNEVKIKAAKDKSSVEQPEEVKRVLSKIF